MTHELARPDGSETSLRIWLIRAAFLPDHRALAAWERWKRGVDLNGRLDATSFLLLSPLYHNLKRLNVDDPLMGKLRGIAKQNWLRNRLLFKEMAKAVEVLDRAGIEVILLERSALALRYLSDLFVAPGDCQFLLVKEAKILAAREVLGDNGWKTLPGSFSVGPGDLDDITGGCFIRGAAKSQLTLGHITALFQGGREDDFWNLAVPTPLEQTEVFTLCPADQVLYACLPMGSPNRDLAERAVEVLAVLSIAGPDVDWDRLIARARSERLGYSLKRISRFIKRTLDGTNPGVVHGAIHSLPVTRWERLEWVYWTKRPSFWGQVPALWFGHVRRHRHDREIDRVIGFARLLQKAWKLDHLWQVPLQGAVRAGKRIAERLGR